MNTFIRRSQAAFLALAATLASAPAQDSAATPYKVINSAQLLGSGGIDYVYADNDGGRLYIPRGNQILVFDIDSLKPTGTITNVTARGAVVDPKSHHGFSSSRPVAMWDSKTLQRLKSIDVQGRPDAILFEPLTERVYVFSHSAPNVTVISATDGSIAGTIDLGGAPEQAVSDSEGHVYVDLEDKDQVAVIDVKTLQVTGRYDLAGKGGTPAGLALDSKNRILFVMCRKPQTCVILDAKDGKHLAALPIGSGSDGGVFNPATMEAFSSQRDGTLTVIKEKSPTSFEVEQTVQTKPGAKTCTLSNRKNQVIVITTEKAPVPAGEPPGTPRGGAPSLLDILVVGR